MRDLIGQHGGIVSYEGRRAAEVLRTRRDLFATQADATAIMHIVDRWIEGDIAEVRRKVAQSWIANGRVCGALQGTRQLGPMTFEKLRAVLARL